MVLLCVIVFCDLSSSQDDGKPEENRPYKFGFNIEGYQHRYEEKDEKGIIMGEYGFITGDGVYHLTVYATDENGNFKIIRTKNVYIGLPGEKTTTPVPAVSSLRPERVKEITEKAVTLVQGVAGCGGCLIPTTVVPEIDVRFGAEPVRGADPATRPFAARRGQGQGLQGGYGGGASPGSTPASPASQNRPPAPGTPPAIQNKPLAPGTRLATQNGSPAPGSSPAIHKASPSIRNKPGAPGLVPGVFPTILNRPPRPGASPSIQNRPPVPGASLAIQNTPQGASPVMQNRPPASGDSLSTNPGQIRTTPKSVRLNQNDSIQDRTIPNEKLITSIPKMTSQVENMEDLQALFYLFNYTLTYHGHHEAGNRNGDKNGSYFFNGRDGLRRNITYIANEFGYQPNITLYDLTKDQTPNELTEKGNTKLLGNEFRWFYSHPDFSKAEDNNV